MLDGGHALKPTEKNISVTILREMGISGEELNHALIEQENLFNTLNKILQEQQSLTYAQFKQCIKTFNLVLLQKLHQVVEYRRTKHL